MFNFTEQIKLTPKQSNIYAHGWYPHARHRVAVCGRRFGKTFLSAREIKRAARLAAVRGIHPDNEIWYGCPTFKQAKRVFWQRMKRAIPPDWLGGKPNESECYMTLKTGHVLRIVGLDNADALRGSGLFFFLGDEWQDAKPECWTEVIQPMLMTCGGNSMKIGTPKGFNHFYDDFNKGQPGGDADHRSFHYTSVQGGNIPEFELVKLRAELDLRTFQQEYEAGFVNYSGRVLYAFERVHHVKPCAFDPNAEVFIGMDFNVNPMTATVWQERDGISLQVDEIIIPTSNTDEMVNEIRTRYARNGSVGHISVYPDAAGAQNRTSAQGKTDISILRSGGFLVVALSSNPLVRDRNNNANARFANANGERRAFVDPKCRKSIEAYEKFAYKEGTSEPDKKSGFDHPVDASGYYFFGRFGGQQVRRVQVGY